jgi:SAM-dependent methyltransferase
MPETSQVRRRPSLPARIFDSIRSRGLKPTLRIVRAYADDAMFDIRYRVSTGRPVDLKDIEVVGDNRDHGVKYQPIKSRAFRAAIDQFRIPPDGAFVDYGSGKGRVLLLAILYGFHQTVGVEFAPDLCQEAQQNLNKFRARTGRHFDASILNVDAARYPVGENDCVFFLYNPFGRKVLDEVLRNIRQSLQSRPRIVHVVYANPVHRQVLDDDPFWRTAGETDSGGLETFVYYQAR